MNKKHDYVNTIYDENLKPFTNYPRKLAKYLISRLNMNQGSKILELGCGRGEFINAFIEGGLEGYGLDISEYSKKKYPKIKLDIQDISKEKKLPYQNSQFDYVFSKSFMEHFHEPEFIFQESNRILKPGGLLITLTPDWEDNFKMFYDDYTHKRPFTIESLKNIQKLCDFEIVSVQKFKQLPSTWSKNIITKNFAIIFSEITKYLTPVHLKKKSKWIRFSKETMLLSIALKK